MRWLWARRRTVQTQVWRLGATIAGVGILYHEIWVTESSEPLLIFLGLWLCGLPPAMFFDGLRRLGTDAKSALDPPDAPGVPKPPADPPKGKDPWLL